MNERPGHDKQISRRGRMCILALCIGIPPLGLGVAGALWLLDRHWLGWAWLVFLCGETLGFALLRHWTRSDASLLPQPSESLPGHFSGRDEAAWKLVHETWDRIDQGEIVCTRLDHFVSLGQEVLNRVAHFYRPDEPEPLLAVQVPLLFRAIEETARDLAEITSSLPFAHRITISEVMRGYRFGQKLKPAYKWYRVYRTLSPLLNWQSGLFRILVTDKMFDLTKETLNQWLLKWYVDRVGYHAIELYSGKLLLTRRVDAESWPTLSPGTAEDLEEAEKTPNEPLRILILGQVKAGKSSLLNALFGDMRAATDVVPTTVHVTPYVLERSDLAGKVLISDMGGYEDPGAPRERISEALTECMKSDLILLVASAVHAAREPDRGLLDQLHARFASHPELNPPPVIVALTHMDLLRPVREWAPPYNVMTPDSPKAESIRGAMDAVAADLGLAPALVIPVCLAVDRVYNVEEALVPSLIDALPEAKRTLLLRSLKVLRDREQWDLLWRQARATGRFLWQIGGELLKTI